MLYFVYIGNNQATISHYTQIVDGVFITTDREEKANDILSNINEQYCSSKAKIQMKIAEW